MMKAPQTIPAVRFMFLLALFCSVKSNAILSSQDVPHSTLYQSEGLILTRSAWTDFKHANAQTFSSQGSLSLSWGLPGSVKVEKAFLLWQITGIADSLDHSMSLDGSLVSGIVVSRGAPCNKPTGIQLGLVADVTKILASKLEESSAASQNFDVQFNTDYTRASAAVNGAALVVVASHNTFAYNYVEVRAGGFAAAKSGPEGTRAVLTNVFAIPAVGINVGDRAARRVELQTTMVGDSEEFSWRDFSEGYFLNGQYFQYPSDGANSENKHGALHIQLEDLSDSEQVNFTVAAPLFCHVFVSQSIQYEKQPKRSSNVADVVEDPHITTWDGLAATVFHEGDFILAESSALGLSVQGRFCKNRRGAWASFTCGVAVRCQTGSGVVEISAENFDVPHFSGDGAPEIAQSSEQVKTVRCPAGLHVTMMRLRNNRVVYLNVRVSLHAFEAADLKGLLGTPNGQVGDDVQSRQGTLLTPDEFIGHFIGHSVQELDDVHASWRATVAENLFSSLAVIHGGAPTAQTRFYRSHHGVERHTTHALRIAEQRRCRRGGLHSTVSVEICTYDSLALGKPASPSNLVKFWAAVADK